MDAFHQGHPWGVTPFQYGHVRGALSTPEMGDALASRVHSGARATPRSSKIVNLYEIIHKKAKAPLTTN